MNTRLQKLVWRSRRGMLEMDVLFQDYISNYGAQLSDHDMDELEKLLAIDDTVLFEAFSGKTRLKNADLDALFADIKARVAEI